MGDQAEPHRPKTGEMLNQTARRQYPSLESDRPIDKSRVKAFYMVFEGEILRKSVLDRFIVMCSVEEMWKRP